MAKYCFNVNKDHVVPQPYPFDFIYWHVGQVGDQEYTLVADVEDKAQILVHWPHAHTIEPLLHYSPENMLAPKRPPSGQERANVRLRFNYPVDAEVPDPEFAEIPSWRQKGGSGFLVWVTVERSFKAFQERWPKAWNVSVIADGMVV